MSRNYWTALKRQLLSFLVNWKRHTSTRGFISVVAMNYLLLMISSICFNLLILVFYDGDWQYNEVVESFNQQSKIIQFLAIVVMGPFLETLIFQLLPYVLLRNNPLTKNRKVIILFISALFFGLSHYYNIIYIFWSFMIGCILMFVFLERIGKGDSIKVVFALHFLCNLTAFLI